MKDLVNTLQQKKFKILLIGDTCIDKYVYGTVERISPEVPVPVLRLNGIEEYHSGMASNVYDNLKAMYCDVHQLSSLPTKKTRFIDSKSGYQLLRIDDDEIGKEINLNTVLFSSYDAVVISDYNKGAVSYKTVSEVQKSFKGPIFIDTKKLSLSEFDGCFVKVNEMEFKSATSLPNVKNLIVTKGSLGSFYNGNMYSTKKVEVHDVTGAGDVHLAALTVLYLLEKTIEKSLPHANKLASCSVQHHGCYTITNKNLELLGLWYD